MLPTSVLGVKPQELFRKIIIKSLQFGSTFIRFKQKIETNIQELQHIKEMEISTKKYETFSRKQQQKKRRIK